MAASERAPPIARLCEETEQGAATPLANDDEEASPEDVALEICRIGRMERPAEKKEKISSQERFRPCKRVPHPCVCVCVLTLTHCHIPRYKILGYTGLEAQEAVQSLSP